MGSASKMLSVFLRLGELTSAVIVLGLVGRFFFLVGEGNSYADSRLVYTVVIACIATVLSILLIPPFTYSFMAFPFDFIMFALWLVAFCLLEALTGINTCNSVWYWSYWGYYWGGYWRNPIVVTGPSSIGWAGCSSWKAVLAWTFISSMAFLCSSAVGAYVMMKYREEKRQHAQALGPAEPKIESQPNKGAQPQDGAWPQDGAQPHNGAQSHNGAQPNSGLGP